MGTGGPGDQGPGPGDCYIASGEGPDEGEARTPTTELRGAGSGGHERTRRKEREDSLRWKAPIGRAGPQITGMPDRAKEERENLAM